MKNRIIRILYQNFKTSMFVFLLVFNSCTDRVEKTNELNRGKIEEVYTKTKKDFTNYSDSNIDLIKLTIDSNFLAEYDTSNLQKIKGIWGCAKHISQEGFPNILREMNYYVLDDFKMNECFDMKLIISALPDSKPTVIEYWRSAHLVTFDLFGRKIDEVEIGRLENNGGRYDRMNGRLIDCIIFTETHSKWTAANGRKWHTIEKEKYIIKKTGEISLLDSKIDYGQKIEWIE